MSASQGHEFKMRFRFALSHAHADELVLSVHEALYLGVITDNEVISNEYA